MSKSQTIKLTPDLQAKIMASIRNGAYPHVAAAAWGVPEHTFHHWMKMGNNNQYTRKIYKQFYKNVKQAQAMARLKAEMEAYQANPILWLKCGPGREGPESPGWTAVVRPMITHDTKTINLFTSPDFVSFMATLRQVLAPYPEALKALVDTIDGNKPQPILTFPPQTPETTCPETTSPPNSSSP